VTGRLLVPLSDTPTDYEKNTARLSTDAEFVTANCFIRSRVLQACGGFDERFVTPGGGLANLDLFKRACEAPGAELVTLLGEGTFHQFHGNAASSANAAANPNEAFDREYEQIRGEPYRVTSYRQLLLGEVRPEATGQLQASVERYQRYAAPDPTWRP
jgi:hypothetical protein